MEKFKRLKDDILPECALEFLTSKGGNKYPGGWSEAYYKGKTPETAEDWIIVTNDGRFYKVNALYMIWNSNYVLAAWSNVQVRRVIKAIRNGEHPPLDPQYQT